MNEEHNFKKRKLMLTGDLISDALPKTQAPNVWILRD